MGGAVNSAYNWQGTVRTIPRAQLLQGDWEAALTP